MRRAELRKHIARGRTEPDEHRSGLVRGYRAGAPVGRESTGDQMRRLVAAQAATIVAHGGDGVALAACSLCAADELLLPLCDGSAFTPAEPAVGHAGATRLPTRNKTALQLQFARFAAHEITEHGSEPLHGHEAAELMRLWGTPEVARRWPTLDTAAATADGQPRLPRTAVLTPSELTPVLKLSLVEINRRIAKLEAKERRLPKAVRRRGGGGARGGGGGGRGVGGGGRGRGRGGPAPKRARATDDAGVLVSARTKLAAHGGDVMAAAARQTQQHLSMPELKALLVSAGLQVGGKKQELAERYRDRAGEAGAGGSGSGDVHLDDAVDDEEEDDADLCEGVSEEVSDEEESDEEESDEEVSDEEESDEEVSDEEVSEEEESDGASGSESE
jgi:hypothetical protein